MLRRLLFVLVAAAALGTAALLPSPASAWYGRGHSGWGHTGWGLAGDTAATAAGDTTAGDTAGGDAWTRDDNRLKD
jgi:hypothetical protein